MNRNAGYNIAGLVASVFGTASPIYLPWGESRHWNAGEFSGITLIEDEQAEYYSCLGTPVFGTVKFLGGSYSIYDSKGLLDTTQMNDFVFPYATLVDFTRSMNVTESKVLGSEGTVKEIYGIGDWEINIRGLCLPDSSRLQQSTVKEQVDEISRWMNICDSINVESSLFAGKNIHALAIKSTSIRAVQGKPDVVSFDITAVSDNPIELIL